MNIGSSDNTNHNILGPIWGSGRAQSSRFEAVTESGKIHWVYFPMRVRVLFFGVPSGHLHLITLPVRNMPGTQNSVGSIASQRTARQAILVKIQCKHGAKKA